METLCKFFIKKNRSLFKWSDSPDTKTTYSITTYWSQVARKKFKEGVNKISQRLKISHRSNTVSCRLLMLIWKFRVYHTRVYLKICCFSFDAENFWGDALIWLWSFSICWVVWIFDTVYFFKCAFLDSSSPLLFLPNFFVFFKLLLYPWLLACLSCFLVRH